MVVPGGLHSMVKKRLLAFDDFSEANNTNVINKALDIGGTWATVRDVSGGALQVQSGKSISTNANSAMYVACNSLGVKDAEVSAEITTSSSATAPCGIIARWNSAVYVASSAGTFLYADISPVSARIVSVVDGVATVVAENTSLNFTTQTAYNCRLIVNGTTASFITPLGTISATIPSGTSTRYGFYCTTLTSAAVSSKIDNFKVEAL